MAVTPPVIRLETHFPYLTFNPNPLPSNPTYIVIRDWKLEYEYSVTEMDKIFKHVFRGFEEISKAELQSIATGWYVHGFWVRKESQDADLQEKIISEFILTDVVNNQLVGRIERGVRRWQGIFWGFCWLTLLHAIRLAVQNFFMVHEPRPLSKIDVSVLVITTLITYGSYKGYQKAALKLALVIASAFDACKIAFPPGAPKAVQLHYQPVLYGY